jgi:hypothetical protein
MRMRAPRSLGSGWSVSGFMGGLPGVVGDLVLCAQFPGPRPGRPPLKRGTGDDLNSRVTFRSSPGGTTWDDLARCAGQGVVRSSRGGTTWDDLVIILG